MDVGQIIEMIVKTYGVPGVIIAILLLVIRVLWTKYEAVMKERGDDGIKLAVAMERNTQALEQLRELIKDRKP